MIILKEGISTIKIIDKPETESELEKDMIDWSMQTTKNKQKSDDKSIELFGKDNTSRYNDYKREFLENPKKPESVFSFDGTDIMKEYVDISALKKDDVYTSYKIKQSKKYSAIEGIIVIYPTEDPIELEGVKSKWDAMTPDMQLKSDDYCKQIWGVTNDDMYTSCYNHIASMKEDEKKESLDRVGNNIIDGFCDTKALERITNINTSEYCIPTVKFVSVLSDNTVDIGDASRDDALSRYLYEYSLIKDKDTDEAKVLEENILALGWIPGILYNAISRQRAALLEDVNKYEIVDKTSVSDENIEETDSDNFLMPIYIVLVEGTSIFSKTIKAVTNGPFSHAALCIDDTFTKMYSFNISGSEGKAGGLSYEDVKQYPKESRLGVFAIFVKKKDYHTIQNLLERYDKNKDKTTYSFFNVIALPFNKAIKMDFNMICSEFVDNILKMTNIDIVDKASPLVTPNDFYRSSKSNKKIFKLYEGKVKNFLPKTIHNRLSRVKKAYIKEMALLESEFPVQFSSDGDLLIKNMSKLNYEEEISRSKRLLKIYYKEDNREGLKYELARLWFIGNLINADIEKGKIKDKNYPPKAHAFNLISSYLKLLMQKEKGFNFMEYYESTPFSDATIKIRASTLKYTMSMIKDFILA